MSTKLTFSSAKTDFMSHKDVKYFVNVMKPATRTINRSIVRLNLLASLANRLGISLFIYITNVIVLNLRAFLWVLRLGYKMYFYGEITDTWARDKRRGNRYRYSIAYKWMNIYYSLYRKCQLMIKFCSIFSVEIEKSK